MKIDNGLDDDCDIKNILPRRMGAFVLSSSRRNMNSFIREIHGFCNNNIHYTHTSSMYIQRHSRMFSIK